MIQPIPTAILPGTHLDVEPKIPWYTTNLLNSLNLHAVFQQTWVHLDTEISPIQLTTKNTRVILYERPSDVTCNIFPYPEQGSPVTHFILDVQLTEQNSKKIALIVEKPSMHPACLYGGDTFTWSQKRFCKKRKTENISFLSSKQFSLIRPAPLPTHGVYHCTFQFFFCKEYKLKASAPSLTWL